MAQYKKRGHHSLVFTAALMSAAAGAAVLSLSTVWFVSAKGRATFDLWKFTLEPFDGPKVEAKHDDLCAASVDHTTDTFCHKIRATRAMVFLVIVGGAYSLVSLACDYWKHKSWLFVTACLATLVATIANIASIILGIQLANDNVNLDKPKHGFFMICLGLIFAIFGLILECVGAARGPRFKNKSMKGMFRQFSARSGSRNKYANKPPGSNMDRPPVGAGIMGRPPVGPGMGQPRPPPPPAMVGVPTSTALSQPPSQVPPSTAPISVNITIQGGPPSPVQPGVAVRTLPPPSGGFGEVRSLPPPLGAPTSQMSMPPPSGGGYGAPTQEGIRRSMPEFRDGGRVSLKNPNTDRSSME